MKDKLKLYRYVNALMAYYIGLIEAELKKDEDMYDKYIEMIKKYRKKQDKILNNRDIFDIIDIAFLKTDAEFEQVQDMNLPFDVLDKEAMIYAFKCEKLAGIKSDVQIDLRRISFGSAFRKDFRKNTLLSIKEMVDKATTPELRERLIEIYYYFIFICSELERELIANPSLLNMQSTYLLRYQKNHPKVEKIDVVNHNLNCLVNTCNRLISSFKEPSYEYEAFASLVILEASILSLLKSLPISEVREFKSHFEKNMKAGTGYTNEYASSIISNLIDQRIKTNGQAKVISISDI